MGLVRRATQTLGVHEGPARGLLMMCLGVVAFLVAAHLGLYIVGRPGDPGFSLGGERGYGEVFFMIMSIWVACLLLALAVRMRSAVLGGWSAAFGYLFLDDWFTVHERLGGQLARHLGVTHQTGELTWLAGVALVTGTLLVGLHLRSRGEPRAVSAVLFGLALALAFCGVALDFVHATIRSTPSIAWLSPYATIPEDGGEIAVMSLVVSFVFAVAYTGHRPRVGRRWGTLFGVDRMLQRDP